MSTSPVEANHTGTEDDTVAANSPKSKDDTVTVKSESKVQQAKCPVCAYPVDDNDLVTCPRCDTPHHRDCWEYTGGCSMFGCDAGRWTPRIRMDDKTRSLVTSIRLWSLLFNAGWMGFSFVALGLALLAPFLYEIQFPSLLIDFLSGIMTGLGRNLSITVMTWLLPIHALVFDRMRLLTILFVSAAAVYTAALVLSRILGARIEKGLDMKLVLPSVEVKNVADRLSPSKPARIFKVAAAFVRGVTWMELAFVGVLIPVVPFVNGWKGLKSGLLVALPLLVILFLFLPAVENAVAIRSAYATSLQNRVAAMLEKGKKG